MKVNDKFLASYVSSKFHIYYINFHGKKVLKDQNKVLVSLHQAQFHDFLTLIPKSPIGLFKYKLHLVDPLLPKNHDYGFQIA